MTGPVSPHVRRIDPDAEAARLAGERKLRTGMGPAHILCDEVHQILSDGEHGFLFIRVTCALPPAKIPPGLARDIADLVKGQCYPDGEA